MSASDKKKLRKEQAAAAMTEKQEQAKKEAKKLKIMTISFVAIIAVVLVCFGWMLVDSYLKVNGVLEKKTIVAVVEGKELNTVEFSYYYSDAIENYYGQSSESFGTSANAMLLSMGLDVSKPLNKQTNPTTGDTWANYFIEAALGNAKADIALYNKAVADESFDINSEEIQEIVDNAANQLTWQGYFSGSVDTYLRNAYCNGATESGYLNYVRRSAIAATYYNAHHDSLKFDDAAMEAFQKDRYNEFSSFSYNYYSVSYSKYLNPSEGTKDEAGVTTYTKEQEDAAREAARKDAEALASCKTLEELNAAIAALPVNKDATTPVSSTSSTDSLYSSLKEEYAEWLGAADRKEFDVKAFPVETTTLDENGNEVKLVNSYNVIMYLSTNTNLQKHGNVRHLLVKFETTTDASGNSTVTEAAKTAAKEEANKLYDEWQKAGATKEAFIEMTKEHSDDPGVKENDGLYEDIHRESQYLEQFRAWVIDPKREIGDHGIVETSEGYHIMYFEGHSDETFRDYLVTNTMTSEEMEKWYDGIVDVAKASLKDTSRLNKGMILVPAA